MTQLIWLNIQKSVITLMLSCFSMILNQNRTAYNFRMPLIDLMIDLQRNSHYRYLISTDSPCLTLLCCMCQIWGNVITSSWKLKNEQLIAATRDRCSLDSLSKMAQMWRSCVKWFLFTLSCNLIRQNISQIYFTHSIKPCLLFLSVCFIVILMLSLLAVISYNLP